MLSCYETDPGKIREYLLSQLLTKDDIENAVCALSAIVDKLERQIEKLEKKK